MKNIIFVKNYWFIMSSFLIKNGSLEQCIYNIDRIMAHAFNLSSNLTRAFAGLVDGRL